MADNLPLENSPLEIYETAYRLHYVDNRISEALKYYEILIKDFPESNECGYAAVQIQKIKANGLIKEFKKSGRSSHPLAVIAFILSILSILFSGALSYYFYSRYTVEHNRVKLALSALSKVYIGDDDEALRVLTELKITDKNDILPFELSSDLYQKQGLNEQARSEYEIYFRLNPSIKPSALQFSKMKHQTNTAETLIKKEQPYKSNTQNQETLEEKPQSTPKKAASTPRKLPNNTQNKQKQIKSLFLVDPDSISYF